MRTTKWTSVRNGKVTIRISWIRPPAASTSVSFPALYGTNLTMT